MENDSADIIDNIAEIKLYISQNPASHGMVASISELRSIMTILVSTVTLMRDGHFDVQDGLAYQEQICTHMNRIIGELFASALYSKIRALEDDPRNS